MDTGIDGAASYTVHRHMQRRWKAVGRKLAFSAENVSEWSAWRQEATGRLRSLIGYDTMERAPLNPIVTEVSQFPEYTRQKIEIQTEPGVLMPLYVLIPRATQPPYPAVLAPHGHRSCGRLAVAGCDEMPEVAATIKEHNYDYGVQFVRAGFITFCPDARGFGERQEKLVKSVPWLDALSGSCTLINNMAISLGQTIIGMWTWELHRLIDYVQTRDDCRADQIGCAGLSGGGLQTLYAAALDERIRCAVISGYLYGFKESLLDMHNNCSCNYVPHLYEYMDMGDIAALIAPRPLLVETGDLDHLNGASGLDNVLSQMEITGRAYRLLDTERLLKHDVFAGEHRWHGVQAIPWMQRFLA